MRLANVQNSSLTWNNFNPRTPCGVRRPPSCLATVPQLFQSTHPVRGATSGSAPAGPRCSNFNPRTPCGVRRTGRRKSSGLALFQSTHPVRGATDPFFRKRISDSDFNPRTPCGVRLESPVLVVNTTDISIHAPRAGFDLILFSARRVLLISIHAPRAGCDAPFTPFPSPKTTHFNPRTPCGVRPFQVSELCCYYLKISIHAPRAGCDVKHPDGYGRSGISIHAPRAGCDLGIAGVQHIHQKFQSTHPVRGATKDGADGAENQGDFNPRTPCGVRPREAF